MLVTQIIFVSLFVLSFVCIPIQAELIDGKTNIDKKSKQNDVTKFDEIRLPKDLIPYFYDIKILTNFSRDIEPSDYNGTVEIYFRCYKTTKYLVLHSKNLVIQNSLIKIQDSNNTELNYSHVTYDSANHFLSIKLIGNFEVNQNYSVFIPFRGFLQNDSAGFFKSNYIDSQGVKRWFVASQMQPIDARKAFPCFDEPWMKARFKISVVHHKTYSARSNMPIVTIKQTSFDTDLVETSFESSIPISSYLVALVIAELKCNSRIIKAGLNGQVNISVCGVRPDADINFDSSLEKVTKYLQYYEKYFEIKYPLAKCDNVGIPNFFSGGMENWGLILFRETNLQSSDVINHEIAHMWFGNIVTVEWWDDIWLNEGFATFMENEQYLVPYFLFHLFQTDSLASAYPVAKKIHKTTDIIKIFNEVTYFKGSMVVRMLHLILGKDLFQRAIKQYITKYQYKSVTKTDLYDTIKEEVIKANVSFPTTIDNIINAWIDQSGHPVVHVNVSNHNTFSIKQEIFLFDSEFNITEIAALYNLSSLKNNNDLIDTKFKNNKWHIPFTYFCVKNNNKNDFISLIKSTMIRLKNKPEIQWLSPSETEKMIKLPSKNCSFILANSKLIGFYRVNYDIKTWNAIIEELKTNHEAIPIENRMQIVNDIFSFARNGILDVTKPFDLFDYLKKETSISVWFIALSHLIDIYNLLESSDVFQLYQKYLIKHVRRMYAKFIENERWLYGIIFKFACELGLEECISQSKSIYNTMFLNKNSTGIPFHMLDAVLCTIIRYGTEKDWNFLSEQYDRHANTSSAKNFQYALSCTKDPILLERYLNDQLNETKVKSHDTLRGISNAAAASSESNSITWRFIKKNWNLLTNKFLNNHIFESHNFISSIIDKFNTESQMIDFATFFEKNDPNYESIDRRVLQAIEKINSNIKWRKRNLEKLKFWLNSQTK